MSDELKLLPCPFCGKADNALASPSNDDEDLEGEVFWSVGCGCTAFVGPWGNKSEAITAWNTRAAPPMTETQSGLVRDALEGAKIKLKRYMEVHGPKGEGPLRDTYVGGLAAEYQAQIAAIDAALSASPIPVERPDLDERARALQPFADVARNIPPRFNDGRSVKLTIGLGPDEIAELRERHGEQIMGASLIVSLDGIEVGDFHAAKAALAQSKPVVGEEGLREALRKARVVVEEAVCAGLYPSGDPTDRLALDAIDEVLSPKVSVEGGPDEG